MTTVRVVLLDAMGTLLALEPPWPLLRAELAARGVAITEAQALRAVRAEIAFYRAHHDEACDRVALDGLRARCTAVLDAALPEHARGLPDLRDALLASLRFTPYPEVRGVLGRLRAQGLRLVVVSNWDVSLHDALRDSGLAGLVDAAVSSAEVGAAKPNPAIFARALELAGSIRPGDALHVGDSLEADVAGARAAGLRAALVVRDGSAMTVPGVPCLPDLRGLSALVGGHGPIVPGA